MGNRRVPLDLFQTGAARTSLPVRPAMSYLCVCGRKWLTPEPGMSFWRCSCGLALTMRNGVIYASGSGEGQLLRTSCVARGGGQP